MKAEQLQRATTLCKVSREGITTIRQWIILCGIYTKEGISTVELATIIANTRKDGKSKTADRGTVTTAVNRMIAAGIVQIEKVRLAGACGKLRRKHYLTDRGRMIAEMGVSI